MSTPDARRAFIVGEALIDVVHKADGTVAEHPGGSPTNVALTLGRLGRQAQLLAWFGQDAHGALITEWLKESHVTVAEGSDKAKKTSVAIATLAQDGSATYEFDLDPRIPAEATVPAGSIVAHTGSIAPILEPGGPDILALLTSARDTATITYDPNARPSLMGDVAVARPLIEEYVKISDVVKVSDEDLEWLYPGEDPKTIAQNWLALGPAVIVVTLGGSGAIGVSAAGVINVAAQKVTVIDTVGAGDSFMGALIHGLWQADLLGADQRENLLAITSQQLTTVLEQCTKVAAITVSRAGANPPWQAELNTNS